MSGGVDYSHSSGIYIGTWVSNVSTDTEIDFYGGYAGEASGISYDLGYIKYHYPNVLEDFDEVYIGLGYSFLSANYAYDYDNENSYLSLGAEYEVKEGVVLSVSGGAYSFKDSSSDYINYDISAKKSLAEGWDVSIAASHTDTTDDKPIATVSFSKGFDL